MPNVLTTILKRWDVRPPCLSGDEVAELTAGREENSFVRQMIVRRSDVGSVDCTNCGAGHRCDVNYVANDEETSIPLAFCPECGPFRVAESQLQRWQICTRSALQTLFSLGDIRINIEPLVDEVLWRVGKAPWGGPVHDLLFAVGPAVRHSTRGLDYLSRHPQSVLFVATARTLEKLAKAVPNTMFALDSVLDFDGERFHLNLDSVKLVMSERRESTKAARNRRPTRRASRLNATAKIRNELVTHLLAARDYAISTRHSRGEAKLLIRPTQEEIARRTGLSKSSISRCFSDAANDELRLLYRVANDVGEIEKYSGSLRRDGVLPVD